MTVTLAWHKVVGRLSRIRWVRTYSHSHHLVQRCEKVGIELVSMLDRYVLGLAHAAIICCNVNVQWLYVFTLRGYNSIRGGQTEFQTYYIPSTIDQKPSYIPN